jgi:class 3 adenylate cyclase/tetratricopeptide (TPR) repeat protein
MKCPKCQFENREEAKFCKECGNKLELTCSSCGHTVHPGSKFCDECGQILAEPKAVPAQDYSQPLSYTPKHLVDKILAARTTIEGERKQVTVLFADVKGFTSISEKLDPEDVQTLISECLVFFTEEIHRYEGAIAQFLGDGVMALFGAPLAHEDAPQRALYAALAIRERLKEYSEKLKVQGIDFNMRIGLNTGLVVVGKIGDDLTMEYTAMGDTVNLASRMESTAQPGTIQVSENTYRLTEGYFEFKPLGEKELKGKTEPVKSYQLLGVGQAKTRLGVSVARGLTPFVGRQKELDQLVESFGRAKKGQGQVVGIVGEPGVGKSRLLLQLRSMLPQGEYGYLEGDCLHYGGSIAYLPFLDMLRAYFDFTEGEQESLVKIKMAKRIASLDEKLQDILPPLQDVLSLKVQDEEYLKLEPQQRREQVFEAIRTLLIRESLNRPLILAIEDLHWIDNTSEELLTYFIDGLANTRVLLILLYRPEYTPVWVSKSYYSQIRVDQLPTGSSSELVQAILEGGEVAADLRTLILTRASGNPLFIEEFTRTLLERGYIQRQDGHYMLTAKPSDIQVPDTIQGIIAARIDRLEANLKRIMQVASVIGRDFAYRILQTITAMKQELKSCLLNLQELEFIYEKSLFPELEYIFKHALTQEVAYNSLLLKRRKEIHEKIGQAIENLYPDRLEEFYEILAHHYSRSENWEKAYNFLKLSGDKALRNYSNWESFGLYKEAMDISNNASKIEKDRKRGVEIRLLMIRPMTFLGYPEGSLEILQQGEGLSRELGDRKSLAAFLSSMVLYFTMHGDPLKGRTYAESCLQEAEEIQDVQLMAPTCFDLCASYQLAGDYFRIVDVAPRVIELLETTNRQSEFSSGHLNSYSSLLAYCGCAMGMMGDFEEGKRFCEKAVSFALKINDLGSACFAEFSYGWLSQSQGDGKGSAEHFQNAARYAEDTQFVALSGLAWMGVGFGYYLQGELQTALTHLRKGLEVQSSAGIPMALSNHYIVLSWVEQDMGDWTSARTYIDEALTLAQSNNERHLEGIARYSRGRLLGKTDKSQYSEAEECIIQGISIPDELKMKPWSAIGVLYLGELHADAGHMERALETLKKGEAEFRRMGMDYWLARTQKVLEKLEARK